MQGIEEFKYIREGVYKNNDILSKEMLLYFYNVYMVRILERELIEENF